MNSIVSIVLTFADGSSQTFNEQAEVVAPAPVEAPVEAPADSVSDDQPVEAAPVEAAPVDAPAA